MLKGKGCTNIKKTEFKNKMCRTLVNTIRHYIYKIHVLFFIAIIHDSILTTIVTFIDANNVYTGTLNKNKLL